MLEVRYNSNKHFHAHTHRYGYATNTSVKFIAILQDAPTRDSELRAVRGSKLAGQICKED